MAQRLPNPCLAKIHRSYTVEEAARLYGTHRNTVRQWIKQGLPVLDDQRPLLILGSDLRTFLAAKRVRNKRPCQPGQLYCMRCRIPQTPALRMADFEPLTATTGNLVGICPACEALMYRRVRTAMLGAVAADLTVTHTQGPMHISESDHPSVNCDFKQGA